MIYPKNNYLFHILYKCIHAFSIHREEVSVKLIGNLQFNVYNT